MEKEYNISYTRGESRKIIKKAPKEYDISKLQASDLYSAYKRYVDKKENEYLELELEKKYTLKDEMDKLYLKYILIIEPLTQSLERQKIECILFIFSWLY